MEVAPKVKPAAVLSLVESSESEDDGLQQVQQMLPQPLEVLQAEKSRLAAILCSWVRGRWLRDDLADP